MSATATIGILTAPTLRRVRRETAAARPSINKPDPYSLLLSCWADYMRTDDRDLGIGGMKLEGEGDPDVDVHSAQRAADMKTGEAVNAMVHSLPQLHRWAIYKSQGIATAWQFANADFGATLSDARDALEEKLQKNIATRIHFL